MGCRNRVRRVPCPPGCSPGCSAWHARNASCPRHSRRSPHRTVRNILREGSEPVAADRPGAGQSWSWEPARGALLRGVRPGRLLGLFAFTAKPSTWQDPAALLTLATVLAFMVCLLVVGIIVPATIAGRSRESLRRKAAADPHFRALLEQDLATWRDPYGDAGYGPL